MDYNYSLIEKVFTEYILSYSGPNKELDDYREEKYSIIKNIILKSKFFPSVLSLLNPIIEIVTLI